MDVEKTLCELDAKASLVRECAPAADRDCDLSEPVTRLLKELGLFKLWVPTRFGGAELDLPQTLRIYERAARIDGSFGWAVMIGSGGGLFAAYLQRETAVKLFSRADAVVAGSGAPNGRAERVPGGYRASGRWRYASGARYASVFTANCIVTRAGEPELDTAQRPLIRAMAFAPAEVSIIRTWDSLGMRATGSHDIAVSDVFVPEDHTFSVFADVPQESGALYRLPFEVLTHLPVAAVASGIAQHALEAFARIARTKLGKDGSLLGAQPHVRTAYAETHARWLAAHLALHSLASRTWDRNRTRVLDDVERAETYAVCTQLVAQLESIVGGLTRLAGMHAITQGEEFARAWRDLQTAAAHASVAPHDLAETGTTLLGEPLR